MRNRLLHHAVARMSFLKTAEKLLVAEVVDTERFFSSLSLNDLAGIVGRKVTTSLWDAPRILRRAELDLSYIDRNGIGTLMIWSPLYPPQLREIYDPPFLLFVRGTLPSWDKPVVSIVGTRKPSEAGLRGAYGLAKEFAAHGVPVVSGLARGIDAAAHRGCVDGGGMTVAVFGAGIDTICPGSHVRLAERVLTSGGAFVGELPPGTPPSRFTFPQRNRIITGLARGTVIVEAPARSGALISADYAMDQGRDVFVHRAGLDPERSPGAAALVEDGAYTVDGAGDVLAEWGIGRPASNELGEANDSPAGRPDPRTAADEAQAGSRAAALVRKELGLS